MSSTILLANLIYVFHIFVVMFILITPMLSTHSSIYILHIVSCLSLLSHWFTNNDMCSLSVLEGKLRGKEYNDKESFIHKFISPIYKISETRWSFVCKIIVTILMFISIKRLTNTDNYKLFKKCMSEKKGFFNKTKCLIVLFEHYPSQLIDTTTTTTQSV
jgi:hypothetical protein